MLDLVGNNTFSSTLTILYYSSWVLVPLFLFILAWDLWITYVRSLYFAGQNYVLLEVKLPREIFKSPKAAEFFMAGLYQMIGEANWHEKYWKGQTRAWFSLELAALNGSVHFFIWGRKGFKSQIESNLYSQYPGIEIFEVPDYTLPFNYDTETKAMWACEFDLTKADAYPIKTYIDYGMDKDPKEEHKIDPMTPLLEFLGSLGPNQSAWIQILIQSHKAEDKGADGKPVDNKWVKAAEKEIEKIHEKSKAKKGEDGKETPGRMQTEGERETIAALERSISKPGFDVGIRVVYFTEKDLFNPANIGGLIGGVTHFNSKFNGFRPARGPRPKWKFFVWKDRSKEKQDMEKTRLLEAYKRRAYFYKPFKSPPFVLNTEELATMYHFPGEVAATPAFSRIESRKAEAPSNLPV